MRPRRHPGRRLVTVTTLVLLAAPVAASSAATNGPGPGAGAAPDVAASVDDKPRDVDYTVERGANPMPFPPRSTRAAEIIKLRVEATTSRRITFRVRLREARIVPDSRLQEVSLVAVFPGQGASSDGGRLTAYPDRGRVMINDEQRCAGGWTWTRPAKGRLIVSVPRSCFGAPALSSARFAVETYVVAEGVDAFDETGFTRAIEVGPVV